MILIVTADEDRRKAIEEYCQKLELPTCSAVNAIKALDELDRRITTPQAIFIDHSCLKLTQQLPMMDFRTHLSRYYPRILPVIVFDIIPWHGRTPHGGEQYMIFPFSLEEFSMALQTMRLL